MARDYVSAHSIDNNLVLGDFKNKLINGSMGIWQRGNNFTLPNADSSVNTYTADRWGYFVARNGGTLGNVSVQRYQTTLNDNPGFRNALQFNVNGGITGGGGTTLLTLNQGIEDVDFVTDKTISLSFMAQASINCTIGVVIQQNFGVGTNITSSQLFLVSTAAITTTWNKFTINNIAIPSLMGDVLGTVYTSNLLLSFIFQSGTAAYTNSRINSIVPTDGYVRIVGVQCEEGIVATNFENRAQQAELGMCQRYYEKSYNIDVAPGTAGDSNGCAGFTSAITGTSNLVFVPFKVSKRLALPNITVYSTVTGTGAYIRNISNNTDLLAALNNIGNNAFSVGSSTAQTAGNVVNFHWAAECEF